MLGQTAGPEGQDIRPYFIHLFFSLLQNIILPPYAVQIFLCCHVYLLITNSMIRKLLCVHTA